MCAATLCNMDAQWVVDALEKWLGAASHVPVTDDEERYFEQRDGWPTPVEMYRTVLELWPVVRAVAEEATPPRHLPPWSHVANGLFKEHVHLVGELRAEIQAQADIERYVRPSAPRFDMSQLHPWVWDSARPLWEVNRQDALNAAARAVNSHLQRKLRRSNSEVDLTNQAFSLDKPTSEGYRLRFPGEQGAGWKSRMGGARGLGEACFRGVRNLTTHEHQLELSEVVAVEYLTMFSTLCRWIEECVAWGEEGPVVQSVVVGVSVSSGQVGLEVNRTLGVVSP